MTGKNSSLFILLLLVSVTAAPGQPSRQQLDSIRKETVADHQQMMTLLGITSLRPGVDGNNPEAPNAANYDEAKANPYPQLPDPLRLRNGKMVKNAKLYRRNAGEVVENLAADGEYHRMAGNFLKYAGPLTWDVLPVDSHELIALCAPRPVFISCGTVGDAWVDARGMFMAAVAAEPVYLLVGVKGLGTDEFPSIGEGLTGGEVAFRQHERGHTPGPNWPVFLEYAARYFNK